MKEKTLFFLIVFFCCLLLTFTVAADTFTVTNNNDDGAGSLRQAVVDGNASAATYTVSFNGAIGTITLLSPLPDMTQEVTFDLSSAVGTVALTGNSSSSSEEVIFDDGTFTFDGGSSVFTMTGSDHLYVGPLEIGILNITNGAEVSNVNTIVGGDANYGFGTGTVTVDGANSTWTNSGDLTIAEHGTGTLNITNGGAVSSVNGVVASNFGTGTVTVDGANSTWTNSGDLTVGHSTGRATLDITNGATVSSTSGTIGYLTKGTVTVDGANSTWTNSGDLTVGDRGGTATLDITNGGAVSNAAAFIGSNDRGTVTVDGAGSTWTNSGNLVIGNYYKDASWSIGTLNITDDATVSVGGGTGIITLANHATATGTLNIGSGLRAGILNAATVTGGDGTATVNFNHNEAAYTFAPVLAGSLSVNQIGTGTTTLTGANSYTGLTTVSAGTLAYGADNVIGTGGLTLSGGTLDIGSYSDTLGTVTLSSGTIAGTTGILSSTGTFEMQDGTVSAILGGGAALNKTTAGTLTLSGTNSYSGGTTINAGTLSIGNANALGTGAVVNNATLDIGANTLNVAGVYTQNNNSKLKVTVNSASTAGRISSASAAAVSAASTVNVTVTDNVYIPNNTTFKIIDGADGAGVNTPATITSSNPRVRFSGSSSNGNLILTADRSGIGFSSLASNSNTAAAGGVLDNISTPTSDMTNVLNTLEGLSNSQTASALETVSPVVGNGAAATSNNALNQFIGTAAGRLEGLRIQARNPAAGRTGVSTGSRGTEGLEAWGKGFGEYIHQKPRGLSNGYHATIWGTAMGGDIPVFNDKARLGISGGYAQSNINSKDNSAKTDIDSYSSMLYGGYAREENPFYLNGAFSLAYNTYEGSRQIAVGAITRTADSDYDGRQYSALVDGGYTFKLRELRLIPVASLQYIRLHLEEYTETGAGALNLNVQSRDYDMLRSGLGLKLERPFKIKSNTIIPEVHAKWLYDFIGDRQETTSTFSGGGGSFTTEGFDPARHSFNLGAKFSLIIKDSWDIETNYDFRYKEDFTAHAGWADISYKF